MARLGIYSQELLPPITESQEVMATFLGGPGPAFTPVQSYVEIKVGHWTDFDELTNQTLTIKPISFALATA